MHLKDVLSGKNVQATPGGKSRQYRSWTRFLGAMVATGIAASVTVSSDTAHATDLSNLTSTLEDVRQTALEIHGDELPTIVVRSSRYADLKLEEQVERETRDTNLSRGEVIDSLKNLQDKTPGAMKISTPTYNAVRGGTKDKSGPQVQVIVAPEATGRVMSNKIEESFGERPDAFEKTDNIVRYTYFHELGHSLFGWSRTRDMINDAEKVQADENHPENNPDVSWSDFYQNMASYSQRMRATEITADAYVAVRFAAKSGHTEMADAITSFRSRTASDGVQWESHAGSFTHATSAYVSLVGGAMDYLLADDEARETLEELSEREIAGLTKAIVHGDPETFGTERTHDLKSKLVTAGIVPEEGLVNTSAPSAYQDFIQDRLPGHYAQMTPVFDEWSGSDFNRAVSSADTNNVAHYIRMGGSSPFSEPIDKMPFGDGFVSIRKNGTTLVYGSDESLMWARAPGRDGTTTDLGKDRGFDIQQFVEKGLEASWENEVHPEIGPTALGGKPF